MEIIQDSQQTRSKTHQVQERQHDGRDLVKDVELSINEAHVLAELKDKLDKSELVRSGSKPSYNLRIAGKKVYLQVALPTSDDAGGMKMVDLLISVSSDVSPDSIEPGDIQHRKVLEQRFSQARLTDVEVEMLRDGFKHAFTRKRTRKVLELLDDGRIVVRDIELSTEQQISMMSFIRSLAEGQHAREGCEHEVNLRLFGKNVCLQVTWSKIGSDKTIDLRQRLYPLIGNTLDSGPQLWYRHDEVRSQIEGQMK